MINDELDSQALEEICYPINDVFLSSSSNAANHLLTTSSTSSVKTRSRTKQRKSSNPPTQIAIPPVAAAVPPPGTIIPVLKHDPAPFPLDHSTAVKNVCHKCNKHFVHGYALRKHLANHYLQVFNCNQCSKTFKHQSTLTTHKASHALNLPYTCEVCSKSFNRISTLKSHRRIHSGAKPFVCHICTKAFYQKGNLKNHLYIHTNERPYRCDICNRGFNQMSNLVCHKKTNHDMEVNLRPPVNHLNITALEKETKMVRVRSVMDDIEVVVEEQQQPQSEADQDVKPTGLLFNDFPEPLDLSTDTTPTLLPNSANQPPPIDETKAAVENNVPMNRNCQMVYEKTENHIFFSKFSVIELPQKIDTLEMRYAEVSNKTPFAMLHFGSDAPCLVEIIQQRGMSILKPIKKHELGNFTFTEPGPADYGANSGRIVITIVATILQSFTKGEFSLFTVKPPEIVRCVKLLVDPEVVMGPAVASGASLANCARGDELRELKNKITIAMSDCRSAAHQCKEEPVDENNNM